MRAVLLCVVEVLRAASRPCPGPGPGLQPGATTMSPRRAYYFVFGYSLRAVRYCDSALALLVPGVGADDHDAAVATDDPALATDLLDARLDLHGVLSSWPMTRAVLAPGVLTPGRSYLYR